MLIKTVLAEKSDNNVIMVEASSTLLAAVKKMCEEDVGVLLIQSAAGIPVGILTERDILQLLAKRSTAWETVKIEEIMSKNPVVITTESTTEQAESIMTNEGFHHLPVIEGNHIVGVISLMDLVKAQLDENTVEMTYLRDYVVTSLEISSGLETMINDGY